MPNTNTIVKDYYGKLRRGDVSRIAKVLGVTTRNVQYVVTGRHRNPAIEKAIITLGAKREQELNALLSELESAS